MDASMNEEDENDGKKEKLPPAGERVLVQCRGFQCLGFLDQDGTWRDAFHGTELNDVESWSKL